MSIETLATQGRNRTHGGLASIDSSKLRQMRDEGLRNCFQRLEESAFRMEFVARIHGKVFINDAAARSINATWHTLNNTDGNIIWIATCNDTPTDYSLLHQMALRKVVMLVCVGEDNTQLHETFGGIVPTIVDVKTMGEAVNIACYAPIDNTKVLFSPATDTGLDTETAGRLFRHEVNEL